MGQRIMLIAILLLAGIGVVWTIIYHPGQLIVPLAVFGIIALLLRFPPARWSRRARPGAGRGSGQASGRPRRSLSKPDARRAKFRVIQGSKSDSDDTETPKYH